MRILVLLLAFSSTLLAAPFGYFDFVAGARVDQFKFNMQSGTGTKASYHFNDLWAAQFGLKTRFLVSPHWYLRGFVNYAAITSGDSTLQPIESPAVVQRGGAKGHDLDLAGAVGRLFCLSSRWSIAPVAGWGFNGQWFWTTGLAHSYAVRGKQGGPFIGVDLHGRLGSCWTLDAGYELHCTYSRATVEPPTILQIRSHGNVAWGQLVWLEALYRFASCWQVGLRGQALSYNINHGTIRPDTQSPTYIKAHTTKMSRESADLSLLIGYLF